MIYDTDTYFIRLVNYEYNSQGSVSKCRAEWVRIEDDQLIIEEYSDIDSINIINNIVKNQSVC